MNHYARAIEALLTIAKPTKLEAEFCKKHPADFARSIFGAEPKPREPTFRVVLNHRGNEAIPVIKEIREFTGLGLREAKELSEGCPSNILAEKLTVEKAHKFADSLIAVGAYVTVEQEYKP